MARLKFMVLGLLASRLPSALPTTVEEKAGRLLAAGIHAYRLGRESFQAGPLTRAKGLLARTVALRPSAEGFFYLGGTLGLLSRPRAAARAYLESLRLDPSVAAAHQNVAQVFDDLGNRSAAYVHYRLWSELMPQSAIAQRSYAMSCLWSGAVEEGADLCYKAVQLDPDDPSIPFDCAQTLILLLPPLEGLAKKEEEKEASAGVPDGSSRHFTERIEPLFQRAQDTAFRSWRGGPLPLPRGATGHSGVSGTVAWTLRSGNAEHTCPHGANAIRDWSVRADALEELSPGGEIYGQRVPATFGGPFTWAGQRYYERGVRAMTLRDVLVSGNEGVISRGCDVFVPYYDVQVPWHENLPHLAIPQGVVRRVRAALWLLVMFPANFFSFLVDELARLAVWLTVRQDRIPLLVPADRGRLKPFMYDWFSLLGGFEIIPYDVRPHFMGPVHVAEPRFFVDELHVVDWRDPEGVQRRGDAFLLPPRWALLRLRSLVVGAADAPSAVAAPSEKVLLWIQRSTATTRRVANEAAVFEALHRVLGSIRGVRWSIRVFSDQPPPTAKETARLFHAADIVVGVHGSGQANQIFCRPGTGIIDINLPEPHSQYSAHNSYALGFRYRLVMMRGHALHQALNVTVPVPDVIDALKSLLAPGV